MSDLFELAVLGGSLRAGSCGSRVAAAFAQIAAPACAGVQVPAATA